MLNYWEHQASIYSCNNPELIFFFGKFPYIISFIKCLQVAYILSLKGDRLKEIKQALWSLRCLPNHTLCALQIKPNAKTFSGNV